MASRSASRAMRADHYRSRDHCDQSEPSSKLIGGPQFVVAAAKSVRLFAIEPDVRPGQYLGKPAEPSGQDIAAQRHLGHPKQIACQIEREERTEADQTARS